MGTRRGLVILELRMLLKSCICGYLFWCCFPGLGRILLRHIEAVSACSNSARGSRVMVRLPSWRGERALLLFRPCFSRSGAACVARFPWDSQGEVTGVFCVVSYRYAPRHMSAGDRWVCMY